MTEIVELLRKGCIAMNKFTKILSLVMAALLVIGLVSSAIIILAAG